MQIGGTMELFDEVLDQHVKGMFFENTAIPLCLSLSDEFLFPEFDADGDCPVVRETRITPIAIPEPSTTEMQSIFDDIFEISDVSSPSSPVSVQPREMELIPSSHLVSAVSTVSKDTVSSTSQGKGSESCEITESKKPKPFTCRYCERRFYQSGHRNEHERTIHFGNGYKCKPCGILFGNKSKLDRHVRSVHNNVRRFECEECGFKFKEKCHLVKHAKAHERKRVLQANITR
ncbi:hypothetical protein NDN08_007210 [Rhodosorus marinus]|uniref:C2H2-type domain-containing protein n=1 Tax=Rhodosorus marinus TaxID=101924 RepID=A0AAV8UFY4_9RHOD|nr:hypothetical protein NDN08_007210 [Rhodosorus marinus]